MTWKPTDEMMRVVYSTASTRPWVDALIAVQPLIAAEARAKALEEAAKIVETEPRFRLGFRLDGNARIENAAAAIRSRIPKPEGT